MSGRQTGLGDFGADEPDEPEPAELDAAQFDPRDLFADDVADQFSVSVEWQDVEVPDDVPTGEKEQEVAFAEAILRAGGNRTGFTHHEEVRRSMGEWAREHEDHEDNPGYWQKHAFGMGPNERNFGRLEGDLNERYEKARTVIAWASDNIEHDTLREIERETVDRHRDAIESAAADAAEAIEAEQFAEDPPAECKGWQRFDAAHDAVSVAYVAEIHGTAETLAIWTEGDERRAGGFTREQWEDFAGDPRDEGRNRVVSAHAGETLEAQFLTHLGMFSDPGEAEPPETAEPDESSDDPRDRNVWQPSSKGYSATGVCPSRITYEQDGGVGICRVHLEGPHGDREFPISERIGFEEAQRLTNRLAHTITPVDIHHAGAKLRRKVEEIPDAEPELVPGDESNPYGFDDYGPTADRPLPAEEEQRETWKARMRARGFSPDTLRDEAHHGDWPDRARADNAPKQSFADEIDAAGVDRDELAELRRIAENEAAAEQAGAIEPNEPEAVTDGGEPDLYEPTDEYDEIAESGPGGIGAGRRSTLDAIDAKDRLDDVQTFNSLREMVNAVREISLARPDGRTYMAPPEKPERTIRSVYEGLPNDEARRAFLNDDVLHRRINAARKAFNRWLGKKKREQQIPSSMEAGPSNYPSKKAKKTARYAREGHEELQERIGKIRSGANGAKGRALEAIGSSIAEQNEEEAQSQIEQRREAWEPGDIVVYRSPDLHAGAIYRVNKKSVRVQRRNNLQGADFGPDGEFRRETIKLDSDHITRWDPDELDEIENDALDREQTCPDTLEAAQRQFLGAEWVEENRDDLTEASEADAAETTEPATDGGEVVEPIAPVADTDDLPSNEPVRLVYWISRVTCTPKIVEGETSSTGKTIEVAHPTKDGTTYRLDTEEILAGESEFRDSCGFELYTPGRFRSHQRTNHAPGPQAGCNEVSPAEDLPDPTHFPEGSDEGGAAECSTCGHPGRWKTENMRDPQCEACGVLDEEEER